MVSYGLCVNMMRLEQLCELLVLSVMVEVTQGTIVSVASEPPMVGQMAYCSSIFNSRRDCELGLNNKCGLKFQVATCILTCEDCKESI